MRWAWADRGGGRLGVPHQVWLVGGLAGGAWVPVISAPVGMGMVRFGKRSGGRNQADDLARAGGHDTAAFAACPRCL
jgi:hypothetical protein